MKIDGLRWEDNWSIPNGGESAVYPIPTLRPTTIVYHGDEDFSYGHFGIHLGQEDVLTFLGDREVEIRGRFIDCREGSPTARAYEEFTWKPDPGKRLHIPAGIAHALDGLGGVNTLNTYLSFLPSPEELMSGKTMWSPEADIVNLPDDITPTQAPLYRANTHPASDAWYRFVARVQSESLGQLGREYPMTSEVQMDTGETVQIKLSRRVQSSNTGPGKLEAACEIPGVAWEQHLDLPSGERSGFVPLIDPRPMYYIDHGQSEYSHDAYGIHCYQEDRLTFLGRSDQVARVRMFDAREDSPTRGLESEFDFSPDARRCLIIPPGVAHAFEHMESIYTVNRAKSLRVLNQETGYEYPDVVDWPLEKRPLPVFPVGAVEVDESFYQARVAAQLKASQSPETAETPAVILVDDGEGGHVRVALRKRVTR